MIAIELPSLSAIDLISSNYSHHFNALKLESNDDTMVVYDLRVV
jgi:hypothetical protein